MIKTLKRPLYNARYLLLSLLSLSLGGLFLYAYRVDHEYFSFLALCLVLSLIYLFILRARFTVVSAEALLCRQDHRERMNLLEDEVNKEWQGIESYCKKILNYSQLKGLTEKLCASLSLSDTSAVLSGEVSRFFGDKDVTVILYLFHSRTGELGLSSSQKGQMRVNVKAKHGDLYDQWVIKVMKPLLVEDAQRDFRFDVDHLGAERSQHVRSVMSVPLMIGTRAIGILRVDSPQPNYFSNEDIRLLSTIGDIGSVAIENAQLFERIEDLAIRDSLTGLFLRRHLLERLSQELARQLRRKRDLSFMMIDLDDFKQYNDHYGHPAGDLVLKRVGAILQETFSDPGVFVCRYGGEEFAAVLPDCSKGQAMARAEALRRRIEQETIPLRRQETHVTVSIGVAAFPQDARLKEELVGKADFALYKAKARGRNTVCGV